MNFAHMKPKASHFLAVLWLALAGQASATCFPYPECESENDPPGITLTAPANGATTTAPGVFTLSATASDADGFVTGVEFFSNNASVGVDATAPYTLSLTGLAAGNYAIKAKATDDAGATSVSTIANVTVTAPTNVPPTVTLTSPANNSIATAPASLVLSASASDSDGTISSVKFKNGSTVLSTDTTFPYSYTWTNVAAGSYVITAQAFDDDNASTTSTAATVTVNGASNNPPTVSLTAPSSGTQVATSTAVNLTATAADSDGSVANVKFFANGALLATKTAAPYAHTWSTSTAGSYAIQAISTDNAGATAASSIATVTVSAPGSVSQTRSYVYDANHRLCKTINPESGATIVEYDGAGNVSWTADRADLTSPTDCQRGSVNASDKVTRVYDARSRVREVRTPGGSADVLTTYYADGKVATLTAANPGGNNVVTTYTYNTRRLLTSERQQNGSTDYTISYKYNPNAHLSGLVYPGTGPFELTYTVDALGRPLQVSAGSTVFASGVQYHPNGAMKSFRYGAAGGYGPDHELQQNARGLPWVSKDTKGSTLIVHDTYTYDETGNVTSIVDAAQNLMRAMSYDALDRLTVAVADNLGTPVPNDALWGVGTYTYDALDNLRTADQGTRQFRYNYDGNGRLADIKNPAGAQLYGFGYDSRGNVLTKNDQAFVFDAMNRMSSASTIVGTAGNQTYRYDGLGRRVQTTDPGTTNPPTTYYLYSQAGQVLYASEARNSRNLSYIYLNGSQIATRALAWGTGAQTLRLQMTDALGSPVASTNTAGGAASIQRTSYTPWGEASPSVDGTGFTGHVMDAGTGLTYMQQRYYDPQVGRFLSVDPEFVDTSTAPNFNRYNYANNNPYRFSDPDGRSTSVIVNNNFPGTGSHAGIVIVRMNPNTQQMETTIYDPGGDFHNDTRGSGAVFENEATITDYISYQLTDGPDVQVVTFETTPEQEQAIVEAAMEQGDPGPGNCALGVSQALQSTEPFTNLETSRTPSGLLEDLQDLRDNQQSTDQ